MLTHRSLPSNVGGNPHKMNKEDIHDAIDQTFQLVKRQMQLFYHTHHLSNTVPLFNST